jgi:hypothetical protein
MNYEEKVFQSLKGKYKHYCKEWDFMAIDETYSEFEACLCYAADHMSDKGYQVGDLKDIPERNYNYDQ